MFSAWVVKELVPRWFRIGTRTCAIAFILYSSLLQSTSGIGTTVGACTLDLGVVLCLVLLALDGQLHAVPREEHLVGAGFLWEGVWTDEFLTGLHTSKPLF